MRLDWRGFHAIAAHAEPHRPSPAPVHGRDALNAGAGAATACVLSAGLVYADYFLHVLRVARAAPSESEHGASLLLFGKHAPRGRIDADFAARLERAASLWPRRPPLRVVLLGGGAPGMPSEAEVARGALLARVAVGDMPLLLEAQSRDVCRRVRGPAGRIRRSMHFPGPSGACRPMNGTLGNFART